MSAATDNLHYRLATLLDAERLQALIECSVRGLQGNDYTAAQREGALGSYFGVDSSLIVDGTYFVVELPDAGSEAPLVAAGGWSRRRTLCGGDHRPGRDDSFLDPATDVAKIRAFFVHPEWARRGIGTKLLQLCENAARAAGFTRFEMGATLTGVPLYRRYGYAEIERFALPLANGESLPIVRMGKEDLIGRG
jgi:GNAT superfamily N-acetyltransferase